MKILVVDDSSTMRRILSNCLKSMGDNEIFEAEDGAEGMEELKNSGGVDLILTDWNMPNVNGLEFIQNVQKSGYKSIPIIMITTEAEKSKIVLALKTGAKNYIVKPFTSKVLKEKINQVMN